MSSPTPRKRRIWVKVLGAGTALTLLVLCCGLALHAYDQYRADRELAEAVAEAEEVAPLRTLREIEASRAEIPADRNAASRVLAAARFLPPGKHGDKPFFVPALVPPYSLDAPDAGLARAESAANEAALAELRDLADLPSGRYRVDWLPNYVSTRLEHLQSLRRAASALQTRAVVQAEDGDARAAARTARAILNAGRSLGDEPCLLAALVRIAARGRSISTLEWVLSQGTCPDADLLAFQDLLREEAEVPSLEVALTGERAGVHETLTGIRDGSLSLEEINGYAPGGGGLRGLWFRYASGPFLSRQHAQILRHYNRLIRLGRQPAENWFPAVAEGEAGLDGLTTFADLFARIPNTGIAAACRSQAQLRCAAVALAAERYRIANDRWPDSLDALRPDFLADIPTDPYGGEPLRVARVPDGIVVYSVGPDGRDDGGKLQRPYKARPGTDLGFQLWDLTARRAAPPP